MELQKRFVVEEAAKHIQEAGISLTTDDISELKLMLEDIPRMVTLSDMATQLAEEFLRSRRPDMEVHCQK